MIKIPERRVAYVAWAVLIALFFGNQGFRKWWNLWWEKRRLDRSFESLRTEQAGLDYELQRLEKDPAYTEYLIRKNLGYVKKSEVEYRILKKDR